MNEKEVVNPPLEEPAELETEKSVVPLWLLGFYILLLIWTLWNVLRYWD
jgi:hypothetical protein